MTRLVSKGPSILDGPLLDTITFNFSASTDFAHYPFSVPFFKKVKTIHFPKPVTFFVGENGTGKSTLLEAIAYKAGFGPEGGSKNIHFKTSSSHTYAHAQAVGDQLTLSWRQKPKDGYFFRAETFYNLANHLDYLERECGGNAYYVYGGKSLHHQSHGESFLSFFENRLSKNGFFILDEPEAALSPQRQLALLTIINRLCNNLNTQFIIATHSPLLLAYPDATIYSCDTDTLEKIAYTDTPHYQITKQFLNNTDLYLRNLFE